MNDQQPHQVRGHQSRESPPCHPIRDRVCGVSPGATSAHAAFVLGLTLRMHRSVSLCRKHFAYHMFSLKIASIEIEPTQVTIRTMSRCFPLLSSESSGHSCLHRIHATELILPSASCLSHCFTRPLTLLDGLLGYVMS